MLSIGTILAGRYELLEQIGSGGMSVVFRGLDHKLNRIVAVKVMKEDFTNDAVQIEKFHKEAWAIAMLTHPNIAGVYDIGTEQGLEYMIKEYVDGITLKEYIRRRRHLTSDEIVKITLKIAEGLKTAHENNVIHRDIKPQNILVTTKGDVKVTDFGIAKFAKSVTTTEHKDAMGSVHYLSPEQARGLRVDGRCDLYSLGITMFEMATGHTPFDGETPVAVALKQINSPLPPIRAQVPELWPGLEAIIIGLTQKNPDDRYGDASMLIADLKRVYNDPRHGDIDSAQSATRSTKKNSGQRNGHNTGSYNAASHPADSYHTDSYHTDSHHAGNHSSAGHNTGKYNTDSYNLKSQPYYVPRPNQDTQKLKNPDSGRIPSGSQMTESKKKAQASFWSKHSAAILGIVLGLLITALIIVVILGIKAFNDGQTYEYAMPNFAGQTVEQAESRIEAMDLKLSISEDCEYVFDNTVPKGQIIRQSVTAGTAVSAEEPLEIQVVVSKGTKPVNVVQNYVGGIYEDVIGDLATRGVSYTINVVETDDSTQNGIVIAQSPEPETEITSETNIQITVAYLKEEFVSVLDLEGLTEIEAREVLEEEGLELGSVTESYCQTMEEGLVVAQDVKMDSMVIKGSAVSVTLSLGVYEGSETRVAGAYLINEELLGHISQDYVDVYAYAVVDGMRQDLIDQTYSRQEILDSRMLLKYYEGTTELHVFLNQVEVFSRVNMGE